MQFYALETDFKGFEKVCIAYTLSLRLAIHKLFFTLFVFFSSDIYVLFVIRINRRADRDHAADRDQAAGRDLVAGRYQAAARDQPAAQDHRFADDHAIQVILTIPAIHAQEAAKILKSKSTASLIKFLKIEYSTFFISENDHGLNGIKTVF